MELLLLMTSISPILAQTTNFSCLPFSGNPEIPNSVHQLTPSAIKVIGALGNGYITGTGIMYSLEHFSNPVDFRGQSWAGGGDADISLLTTLPNILRQYNPDLYGYAEGASSIRDFFNNSAIGFHLGQYNASSEALLSQAQKLVVKMQGSSDLIDFDNDWKLVTVYADSNDQCSLMCTGKPSTDPSVWIQDVTAALDYLRDNLPRTLVNLVQLINIQDLYNEILGSPTFRDRCKFHIGYLLCQCRPIDNFSVGNNFRYANYQENLEMLVNSMRYEESDDFTVVLQPFLSSLSLRQQNGGDIDLSPFIDDCYSFSQAGNQALAVGLWNNMFERVGSKTRTFQFPPEIVCPTDDQPYIFTPRNSVNCGLPLPPLNGSVGNFTGTPIRGDTITYQCNEGFLPPSTFTAVCTHQMTWLPSPRNHFCDLITASVHLDSSGTYCPSEKTVFNCSIASNAEYLHLIWSITLPGQAPMVATLDGNSDVGSLTTLTSGISVALTEVRNNYIESVLTIINHQRINETVITCKITELDMKSETFVLEPADPFPPTNLTYTVVSEQPREVMILFEWDPPARNGPYNYTFSSNSSEASNVVNVSSPALNVSLARNSRYMVHVESVNCHGRSPPMAFLTREFARSGVNDTAGGSLYAISSVGLIVIAVGVSLFYYLYMRQKKRTRVAPPASPTSTRASNCSHESTVDYTIHSIEAIDEEEWMNMPEGVLFDEEDDANAPQSFNFIKPTDSSAGTLRLH